MSTPPVSGATSGLAIGQTSFYSCSALTLSGPEAYYHVVVPPGTPKLEVAIGGARLIAAALAGAARIAAAVNAAIEALAEELRQAILARHSSVLREEQTTQVWLTDGYDGLLGPLPAEYATSGRIRERNGSRSNDSTPNATIKRLMTIANTASLKNTRRSKFNNGSCTCSGTT